MNNNQTQFIKGCYVSGKKWNGQNILGIYLYTFNDNSYCVLDIKTQKKFNVKQQQLKLANTQEIIIIKKFINDNNIILYDDDKQIKENNNLTQQQLDFIIVTQ